MGHVESCEPQTRGLNINSVAGSFSPNLLVYFAEISSYFSMKRTKRKLRKCLKCMKEVLARCCLYVLGNI